MARTVVVSGGGTGIGRAVAQRFAEDGDLVVLIGRRDDILTAAASDIATADGPEPVVVSGDLGDPAAAAAVAEEIERRAGAVDVVVAAAGGNAVLADDRPDGLEGVAWHWTENFRLNTLTAVLLTEALRPRLADGARVVLVSSIAAYRGSGNGSYAGAKAALHPYAYDLAAELGPRGVTVNVVAPGYVAGTDFFRGRLSAEREQTLVAQTHTGRAAIPEDVADTVFWLASPSAGHVTAQIVQVNGGAERGR